MQKECYSEGSLTCLYVFKGPGGRVGLPHPPHLRPGRPKGRGGQVPIPQQPAKGPGEVPGGRGVGGGAQGRKGAAREGHGGPCWGSGHGGPGDLEEGAGGAGACREGKARTRRCWAEDLQQEVALFLPR